MTQHVTKWEAGPRAVWEKRGEQGWGPAKQTSYSNLIYLLILIYFLISKKIDNFQQKKRMTFLSPAPPPPHHLLQILPWVSWIEFQTKTFLLIWVTLNTGNVKIMYNFQSDNLRIFNFRQKILYSNSNNYTAKCIMAFHLRKKQK